MNYYNQSENKILQKKNNVCGRSLGFLISCCNVLKKKTVFDVRYFI